MLESNGIRRRRTLTWPDDYYGETDPEKRHELLKEQLSINDSEENRIRHKLFEKRYITPEKGITGTDYYMKVLMSMEKTAQLKKSFLGKKAYWKGLQEIRDIFCLDLLKEKPAWAGLWEEEFFHLWCLYIETCRDDNNYAGLLLGTGRMSKDRLIDKLKADIHHKSTELPESLGLSEELLSFRTAASEAFYSYYS